MAYYKSKEKLKFSCNVNKRSITRIANLPDEGLGLDLPRGSGRSIGGDLDIGEEGSEQLIITLQSLHQHVRT
jgi:hypothetical protein